VVEEVVGGYHRLLKWWLDSISDGGRWKTLAVWAAPGLNGSSPAVRSSRTCPRPRRHGFRELSRGGRRKNDVVDAAAAASVAAARGDGNCAVAKDLTAVLALLDERRDNVITQQTGLINQLHALLRGLVPGGAPTNLRRRCCIKPMGALAMHRSGEMCPFRHLRNRSKPGI
jgi:hypothetical protein